MHRAVIVLIAALLLVGCGPVTPERAAQICEDRARQAQSPFGNVTIGTNSRTGGFASAELGVSLDYLRGADPMVVYERCVVDLTGQGTIRPPALR